MRPMKCCLEGSRIKSMMCSEPWTLKCRSSSCLPPCPLMSWKSAHASWGNLSVFLWRRKSLLLRVSPRGIVPLQWVFTCNLTLTVGITVAVLCCNAGLTGSFKFPHFGWFVDLFPCQVSSSSLSMWRKKSGRWILFVICTIHSALPRLSSSATLGARWTGWLRTCTSETSLCLLWWEMFFAFKLS